MTATNDDEVALAFTGLICYPNRAMPLRRFSDLIVHLEPLILLLGAPALLFPGPLRLFALLLVPLLWLCAWYSRGHFLERTPLDWPLLLLASMVLVGLWIGYDRDYALPKIAGVLLGIGAYYAVSRRVHFADSLWTASRLFILAGAGIAVLALVGTDWTNRVAGLREITRALPVLIRPLGFRIHPNSVGSALLFFVPLQIALLIRSRSPFGPETAWPGWRYRAWVIAQALLVCLTGGVLVLTQSRGTWGGFIIGLSGLLLLHGPRTRKLLAVLVLATAATVAAIGPQRIVEFAADTSISDSLDSHLRTRPALWAEAIDALRHTRLTGFGLHDFSRGRPALPPPSISRWPDVYFGHPHNMLLGVGVDLGLPGLIAFLALWIGAFQMLIRVRRRSDNPWLRAVAEGLAAGMLAHFVFGLADTITFDTKIGIVLWLTLGLVAALHRVAFAQSRLLDLSSSSIITGMQEEPQKRQ